MKIEWLNAEMTEAVVTRGRRWARAKRMWLGYPHVGQRWTFAETDRYIGWWTNWRLERRRDAVRAAADTTSLKNWQPVRSLPRAEVKRG